MSNTYVDENPTVVIEEKMADALTPGYEAEYAPEEAEMAGAFVENALTEQDALESTLDLAIALKDENNGKQ